MNNTPIEKDRLEKELSFGKRAVSITSGITTGTPVKRFNDMNTPIENIDVIKGLELLNKGKQNEVMGMLADKIHEVIDVLNAMREVPIDNIYSDNIGKIEY